MDKNGHVSNKDKRVLAGMMSELDDSVGRILGKLRELKLARTKGVRYRCLVLYSIRQRKEFQTPAYVQKPT